MLDPPPQPKNMDLFASLRFFKWICCKDGQSEALFALAGSGIVSHPNNLSNPDWGSQTPNCIASLFEHFVPFEHTFFYFPSFPSYDFWNRQVNNPVTSHLACLHSIQGTCHPMECGHLVVPRLPSHRTAPSFLRKLKKVSKKLTLSWFLFYGFVYKDHLLLAWLVSFSSMDSTMLKAPPGAPYAPAVGDAQKWRGFRPLVCNYSPDSWNYTYSLYIWKNEQNFRKKKLPKFFQLGPQYQIWSEKTWFFPNHQIEARPVGPPHLPPFGNLSCKGCSICLTCKRGRFQWEGNIAGGGCGKNHWLRWFAARRS